MADVILPRRIGAKMPEVLQLEDALQDFAHRLSRHGVRSPAPMGAVRGPVTGSLAARFDDLLVVDTVPAAAHVTLPKIAASDVGRAVAIYRTGGTNAVNVHVKDGDKVDGSTSSVALNTSYQSAVFVAFAVGQWLRMAGTEGILRGDLIASAALSADMNGLAAGADNALTNLSLTFDAAANGDVAVHWRIQTESTVGTVHTRAILARIDGGAYDMKMATTGSNAKCMAGMEVYEGLSAGSHTVDFAERHDTVNLNVLGGDFDPFTSGHYPVSKTWAVHL